MTLEKKQQLWSKYYMLNDTGRCDIYTLTRFIFNEVKDDHSKDRAKKILKCMLSYLPKREIANKYTSVKESAKMSKKHIIHLVVERIIFLGGFDGIH